MTTEFGMLAALVGFNLIDGLGNMWADKAQEKKIKEDLQEQRELEESYRERILGPGLGGGFSEHLPSHELSNVKYFIPAILSAAEMGAYQLATNVPKWLSNIGKKKAAKDTDATNNPNNTGEGLTDIPIAAAGSGNPDVQNKTGQQNTGMPVGLPWPGSLIMGSESMDADQLANVAKLATMLAKKGTKLIPRQK